MSVTRADRERAVRWVHDYGDHLDPQTQAGVARWVDTGDGDDDFSDPVCENMAADFAKVRAEGMRAGFEIAREYAVPQQYNHSGSLEICWDYAEENLEKAVGK